VVLSLSLSEQKMMKTSNVFLITLNVILTIVGIYLMYFTSIFWMGSKEAYDGLISESYWSFFANRIIFNLVVAIVLTVTIGLINWLLNKLTKSRVRIWRVLLIDLLIFTVSSIVFIAIQLS